MSIDGQNFAVPTASLEVLAPNQQDLLRQQKQRQKEEDLKKAAFIEFSLPRKYLFQGETVVSKISLLLWDKMPFTSIENAPVKIGDAFSLTELGQPIENRNIRRFNKSYTSYTWSVGLTAAITGEQTLSYYSNVRIRTQNRNPSPFNSPFFNDPFFGFGREENLKVSSPVNTIEIRPLPVRDRPKSFSGAIGNFFINSSIDSSRVSVGDPVRLTFTIKGNGNFSAMPAPIFEPSSKFKVGPPAFSFSGNKQTKFEGTQNFEYVITPLAAGLIKIPSPTFTFFLTQLKRPTELVNLSFTLLLWNLGKNGLILRKLLRREKKMMGNCHRATFFKLTVNRETGTPTFIKRKFLIQLSFGEVKQSHFLLSAHSF